MSTVYIKISKFNDYLNPFFTDTEYAEGLRFKIEEHLLKDDRIVLDCSSAENILPCYWHEAVGRLYEKFNKYWLDEHFQVIHLSENELLIYKRCIKNAKMYYNLSKKERKEFDKRMKNIEEMI